MDGAAPRNPPIPREARRGGEGGRGGGGARDAETDRRDARARRGGESRGGAGDACRGATSSGRGNRDRGGGCGAAGTAASNSCAAISAGDEPQCCCRKTVQASGSPRGRPIFRRRRRWRREGGRCDVYQNATNHHSEPPSASLMRCHETRGGASADYHKLKAYTNVRFWETSRKRTCGLEGPPRVWTPSQRISDAAAGSPALARRR